MTSNDLWPLPKTIGFFLSAWQSYISNMKIVGHSYLKILRLRAIYEVFAVLPPMTSNDLWPLPKTIGFFLSAWQSYISNMKIVSHSYLEILRLQGFQSLTSGDLKWPLTSTKNNRVLPLKMTKLYPTYENCRSFLSSDIAITSHQGGGKASDWVGEGEKALSFQSSSHHNKSIYQIWKVLIITILRYRNYKPFSQF